MTPEIRPPTPEEFAAFYQPRLVWHEAAIVDGKIVAVAGISREGDSYWGFLDIVDHARLEPRIGKKIVWALREGLRRSDHKIHVQCADARAERLLQAIGLVPTDGTRGRFNVWVTRNG